MRRFIELHDKDGHTRIINLDYVEEIWEFFGKATVYFSLMHESGVGETQDAFETAETYDEVKKMIEEAEKC